MTTKATKSMGMTPSERLLAKLCEATFLKLWSYPNVFRDQGRNGKGDGKELCDLLVVCGNDIVIFSDKSCRFGDCGDINVDWTRWYKRAIAKSADQIFGAERWIRKFPDQVYVDCRCSMPLPVTFSVPSEARIHRVVVALGAKKRCKRELKGSGSLWLRPSTKGNDHTNISGQDFAPFHIGQIDPSKGFVHVFDDVTLNIILRELDTITDFVTYLDRKEHLVLKGKLQLAEGEENLLASYLSHTDAKGSRDFGLPFGYEQMKAVAGYWEKVKVRPEFQRKKKVQEISYTWDEIIDEFGGHVLNGSILGMSGMSLSDHEKIIRSLALESRLDRRMLMSGLYSRLKESPNNQISWRTILSAQSPEKAYVFGIFPYDGSVAYEEYRTFRQEMLKCYCFVLGSKRRELKTIIGISTEGHLGHGGSSTDLVLVCPDEWNEETEQEARRLQERLNIHNEEKQTRRPIHASEYPLPLSSRPGIKRSGRVKHYHPCPCGSGSKYKKCCGRPSL